MDKSFVASFRPRTDPAKFAEEVPFNIRAIRTYTKQLTNTPNITDYQIIFIYWKTGLIKGEKPEKTALLENMSETQLHRMNRWLGTCVFASGFDSYWAEAQRL